MEKSTARYLSISLTVDYLWMDWIANCSESILIARDSEVFDELRQLEQARKRIFQYIFFNLWKKRYQQVVQHVLRAKKITGLSPPKQYVQTTTHLHNALKAFRNIKEYIPEYDDEEEEEEIQQNNATEVKFPEEEEVTEAEYESSDGPDFQFSSDSDDLIDSISRQLEIVNDFNHTFQNE